MGNGWKKIAVWLAFSMSLRWATGASAENLLDERSERFVCGRHGASSIFSQRHQTAGYNTSPQQHVEELMMRENKGCVYEQVLPERTMCDPHHTEQSGADPS